MKYNVLGRTGFKVSEIGLGGEYLEGKPMSEVLNSACKFVVRAIHETIGDSSHNYGVKFEQVLKK